MGRFGMAMVWIEFHTNQIRQRVREEGSPELGVGGGEGRYLKRIPRIFLTVTRAFYCSAFRTFCQSFSVSHIAHILSVMRCPISVSNVTPHLCQSRGVPSLSVMPFLLVMWRPIFLSHAHLRQSWNAPSFSVMPIFFSNMTPHLCQSCDAPSVSVMRCPIFFSHAHLCQ